MTLFGPLNRRQRSPWIRWLILSVLMVTVTVALVLNTEKQEMEIAIAVDYTNLARDLVLVDPSRQSINLMISGTPATLATFNPSQISCRLDLSGLEEGTHTIPLRPVDIRLPDGLSLLSLLTPSLIVRLKAADFKTVGVIAALAGNPAPGYAVSAVTLTPDRVNLKGTATMLNSVDTVKTHPINLENASESFKKEVPLNLPEAIAVDPPLRLVVAEIEVRERLINRVLENIPVSVEGTPTNHQIHPEAITLTVSGPEALVIDIESDPAFGVIVDLNDLSPGTHSLKATISLPVGTTLIHASPERFSVTINN